MDVKRCCTCKQYKVLTEFCKCATSADGVSIRCKGCDVLARGKRLDKTKIENKEYKSKYRDELRIKRRTYVIQHKDKIKLYMREYLRAYRKKRLKEDATFKLARRARSQVHHALFGYAKADKTFNLIGCSAMQLRHWFSYQFEVGMTWDNYGMWHMDHVIPLSWFNLEDKEQQAIAFHWTNMQPLWAKDNLSKGNRRKGK
jgi:hypothetical protein